MAKDPHRLSWIVGKEECSAGRNKGRPPFNSEFQINKVIILLSEKEKQKEGKKRERERYMYLLIFISSVPIVSRVFGSIL